MKNTLAPAAVVLALSACAPSPERIEASSVSPALYTGQTCAALVGESVRISRRLEELTGRQTQAANHDTAMTAVSLILFWPAAFFIGATGDHATEIARLRGEAEAVASAARARGC